ncbi:hypothetical protein EF908_03270 [Streptomyces sp. WAC04770]|nr:hypothetical protein [Streptomyces sp. WAC04770]RST24805.1 hypothetical protein EF908_03270 [Streptomyces sp. WAC04770]
MACTADGHGLDSDAKTGSQAGENIQISENKKLIEVMKEIADSGKGFSLKDATNLGRYIYHGQVSEYLPCFAKEVPKLQAVDLYVVRATEKCPPTLGAKVAVPTVPDFTGQRLENSMLTALLTGYRPDHALVFKVNDDSSPASPEPLAKWQVCSQDPKAHTNFDALDHMNLYVAEDCHQNS